MHALLTTFVSALTQTAGMCDRDPQSYCAGSRMSFTLAVNIRNLLSAKKTSFLLRVHTIIIITEGIDREMMNQHLVNSRVVINRMLYRVFSKSLLKTLICLEGQPAVQDVQTW